MFALVKRIGKNAIHRLTNIYVGRAKMTKNMRTKLKLIQTQHLVSNMPLHIHTSAFKWLTGIYST